MNELQKFTSELTLSNGNTREKNLYKLQNTLCPQIYSGKNVDEIKRELERNTILFLNIKDNDFLSLLKTSLELYVEDRQDGKKPIYNGDYIVQYFRLLKYMQKYNFETWGQLKEYVEKNINSDYWDAVYKEILYWYVDDKRDRSKDYMSQPHDPIADYTGRKAQLDELKNIEI